MQVAAPDEIAEHGRRGGVDAVSVAVQQVWSRARQAHKSRRYAAHTAAHPVVRHDEINEVAMESLIHAVGLDGPPPSRLAMNDNTITWSESCARLPAAPDQSR